MAVSSPALRDALADIAGAEHVESDHAALAAAAVDGVAPRWVVRAGSDLEVSGVLALASAERLAVSPRGSGSGRAPGNPPRRLDVVLDVSRLAGVTEYVAADLVASVAAGTPLGAVQSRLSREGQRLPLDPPGADRRTIGGILAANASGPLRFRYGGPRDLLLGVRFVLADGTITWGGSRVVKSVTGYDVPKLLVGSLGTIGVIASATLRLQPVPPAVGSWRCAFSSADGAEAFLAKLLASSVEPERVALLNASAERLSGGYGRGPSVLVSIASTEEAVAAQGSALATMSQGAGGDIAAAPPTSWSALEAVLDAPVVVKLAVEVRKLAGWLARAEALASGAGAEIAAIGQAGDGVLHLAARGPAAAAVVGAGLLERLRDELGAEGGSAVVERAPAEMKAGTDVWGAIDAETLGIMARIKHEFDPLDVLNPGRFVGGL